jgi:hypothetical protein
MPMKNSQIACRSRCCGRLHTDRQSTDSTRMSELTPRYALALLPARNLRWSKCDATMNLRPWWPYGFDIRTFDCIRCNYAHIVTSASALSKDTRSLNDMAADALEEVQSMAPGAQRSELKKRGFSVELRTTTV